MSSPFKSSMILFLTEEEINDLVSDLATSINVDYKNKEITLICPLQGSCYFLSDLMRKLNVSLRLDFVHLKPSSQNGSIKILKDISLDIKDRHVLIVEEIINSGKTLSFLKRRLEEAHPASLKIVALLDKPARRTATITPDYIGKTVDDRFLIGYGMDAGGIGRNYKEIYHFTQ